MTTSFNAELGILDRVDGSASYKFGATSLICSVSGPIEAKARQELPTSAALEVTIRPDVGVSSTREKLTEDKLKSVLGSVISTFLYPRQLIQVVVQILDAGEAPCYVVRELVGCINACYLALIDAKVGISESFYAKCVAIEQNTGKLILDPTDRDLTSSKSHHAVCFSLGNGKSKSLLYSESFGQFTEEELLKVLDFAAEAIEQENIGVRKVISEAVSNDYVWMS
ncbi:unnamed protein product [Kuraishia capsulata CBS 1993]|uniref:Uncharacterized protein n=1 Tax=Kuraishia capsulata CBS 1993 TaxID=1382522 RepID=W6MUK2_9ASCO|nr:uncharacterized protein KUCA_T00001670001 [Kuraishia capsulata CBS 1993]CDK25700.1 unnamed protein product [Kuraishia capsulata CBS 1993]